MFLSKGNRKGKEGMGVPPEANLGGDWWWKGTERCRKILYACERWEWRESNVQRKIQKKGEGKEIIGQQQQEGIRDRCP